MSFTLGRLGSDITLRSPSSVTRRGRAMQIDGYVTCSSAAELRALRWQLQGLLDNPDEQGALPFTYSYDSTLNGFYAVGNVEYELAPGLEKRNRLHYSIDLQQVATPVPLAESYILGAGRTTTPGGVTADFWHAVPAAATGYYSTAFTPAPATRTGPSGSVDWYQAVLYPSTQALVKYQLPLASWYSMASKFTADGYTVTGLTCSKDSDGWVLSNGLITIEPGAANLLKVTWPIGATPGTAGTAVNFDIGYDVAGTFTKLAAQAAIVTVLRNSAAEVAIRLTATIATATANLETIVHCDVSLRRGSYIAECYIWSPYSDNWGMCFNSVTATTSITGGCYQTTANANNNRGMLLSGTTHTLDTTNGELYATAATTGVDVGLGFELNGTSSAAPNTKEDIRDQYFAAQRETFRPVRP